MKFLFDLFPVVLFFIILKKADDPIEGMITATAVLIAATLFQIAYNWFRHKKIEKMHVVTAVLVTIFGGATIYFKDPIYIIWKVTVVNWLFAIAFYAAHFIGTKTPLVKRMMQANISMPESVWIRLSYSWIFFFILTGVINLFVADYLDWDLVRWADFKLFGVLGLTLIFVVIQGIVISKYVNPEDLASESEADQSNTDTAASPIKIQK